MLAETVACVLVAAALLLLRVSTQGLYYKGAPPGSAWPRVGRFVVGESGDFMGVGWTEAKAKEFGPVFWSLQFFKPVVFVVGAKLVRELLLREYKDVQASWPTSTKMLLGKGSVSVVTGPQHRIMRQLLNPGFSDVLVDELYTPLIERITRAHLAKWAVQPCVDVGVQVKQLAFEIAWRCLLNLDAEQDTEVARQHFLTFTRGLFSLPINLPFTELGKSMRARNAITDLLSEEIKKRRSAKAARGDDLLQMMMDAQDEGTGVKLTDAELCDMCITLLFAGHDTTNSTFQLALHYLAREPDWRRRLREEQQAVVKQFGTGAASLSGEAEGSCMPLLNACIRETQRLVPIVGGVFREALQDFEVGGYQVRKGTTLLVSIGGTDKLRPEMKDPDKFDPERFLGERDAAEGFNAGNGWGFVPFGGGPRKCLGYPFANRELRLMLALLLRGYDWEHHGDLPTVCPCPLMLPQGFRMRMTPVDQ
eukprot:TRINITY_DN675_c0_g1_i1.p1 TRINITY_DN675_c0_g1~~TRINITY_DN675_c0_g1_i1.p1  ORF type:complete len:494 (+),score=160.31 TRINITY_DN675_c0_g1_i1:49-1482(+)